ncbi:MAG: hypothetical protein V1494_07040 [Candidatus Diapherotrites archaeon]
MGKINGKTKKAIQEIPVELKKLNKIIAVIGDGLMNVKIDRLRQDKEDFNELVNRKKRI